MAKDEFGTNKTNLFNKDDDTYIETLVIKGKMINVFASDYGQCYWFQWVNDKGELQSNSCGTYNLDYKDEIEGYFESEVETLHRMLIYQRDQIRDLMREIAHIESKAGIKPRDTDENQ